MDISDKVLADERYVGQIQVLSEDTLKTILNDRLKTLEYAHKGIRQIEPERINDIEYLEVVADGMQKLAKVILEKRSQDKD